MTLAERLATQAPSQPKPAPVPEWVRRAQEKRLVAKDMGR